MVITNLRRAVTAGARRNTCNGADADAGRRPSQHPAARRTAGRRSAVGEGAPQGQTVIGYGVAASADTKAGAFGVPQPVVASYPAVVA
jgi:hypothetical protein